MDRIQSPHARLHDVGRGRVLQLLIEKLSEQLGHNSARYFDHIARGFLVTIAGAKPLSWRVSVRCSGIQFSSTPESAIITHMSIPCVTAMAALLIGTRTICFCRANYRSYNTINSTI